MNKQIITLLSVLLLTGCGGPFWQFPGGELSGQEAAFVSAPTDVSILQLETRPEDPYSVNLGFVTIDTQIYIDPTAERGWYKNIDANPNVRIRFDGHDVVHPAVAVRVQDRAILDQFDADRIVLRLDPR